MQLRAGLFLLSFTLLLFHPLPGTDELIAQEPVSQTDKDTLVFGISATPGLGIPIGERTTVFSIGGGSFFEGHISLPFYPPLSFALGTGYNVAPVRAETSLSMIYGGGGLKLQYVLLPFLGVGIFADGGFSFNILNSDATVSAGTPYVKSGLTVSFFINPQFSINVEGAYRHFFDLYQDISLSVGITYFINLKRVKAIEFTPPRIDPVFPIMMEHYKEQPIGKMLVKNIEDRPLEEVEAFLDLEEHVQGVRQCRVQKIIPKGQSASIELLADFSDTGLVFPEEVKVNGEITVSYKYKSIRYKQQTPVEVVINPNQTIIWDDYRKIGLFVSESGPAVKTTAETINRDTNLISCRELDPALVTAMGLYNTLSIMGVTFNSDSNTSYKALTGVPGGIDSVQFPNQTLQNLTGDSAELAILFASLLEAANIETAFLATPKKMLLAFSPTMSEGTLQYTYYHTEQLFIEKDGRFWIPVDLTDPAKSFREAVFAAKMHWSEQNNDSGNLDFYTLAECREAYRPLPALGGSNTPIDLPEDFPASYKQTEALHIDWMIEDEIKDLQQRIDKSGGDNNLINQLGVLYAKYEKYDDAIAQFYRTTVEYEYMPSLVNLGNIYYLQDDLRMAIPFYERAYAVSPFDPRVLLAVAKVNHKLENYGNARDAYDKLVSIEPELAEQFIYLSLTGEEAVEAAQRVKEKDVVVWIDE